MTGFIKATKNDRVFWINVDQIAMVNTGAPELYQDGPEKGQPTGKLQDESVIWLTGMVQAYVGCDLTVDEVMALICAAVFEPELYTIEDLRLAQGAISGE